MYFFTVLRCVILFAYVYFAFVMSIENLELFNSIFLEYAQQKAKLHFLEEAEILGTPTDFLNTHKNGENVIKNGLMLYRYLLHNSLPINYPQMSHNGYSLACILTKIDNESSVAVKILLKDINNFCLEWKNQQNDNSSFILWVDIVIPDIIDTICHVFSVHSTAHRVMKNKMLGNSFRYLKNVDKEDIILFSQSFVTLEIGGSNMNLQQVHMYIDSTKSTKDKYRCLGMCISYERRHVVHISDDCKSKKNSPSKLSEIDKYARELYVELATGTNSKDANLAYLKGYAADDITLYTPAKIKKEKEMLQCVDSNSFNNSDWTSDNEDDNEMNTNENDKDENNSNINNNKDENNTDNNSNTNNTNNVDNDVKPFSSSTDAKSPRSGNYLNNAIVAELPNKPSESNHHEGGESDAVDKNKTPNSMLWSPRKNLSRGITREVTSLGDFRDLFMPVGSSCSVFREILCHASLIRKKNRVRMLVNEKLKNTFAQKEQNDDISKIQKYGAVYILVGLFRTVLEMISPLITHYMSEQGLICDGRIRTLLMDNNLSYDEGLFILQKIEEVQAGYLLMNGFIGGTLRNLIKSQKLMVKSIPQCFVYELIHNYDLCGSVLQNLETDLVKMRKKVRVIEHNKFVFIKLLLTFVSAIFLPLQFASSFFGMNFDHHLPLVNKEGGTNISIGIVLFMTVGFYVIFLGKRWLDVPWYLKCVVDKGSIFYNSNDDELVEKFASLDRNYDFIRPSRDVAQNGDEGKLSVIFSVKPSKENLSPTKSTISPLNTPPFSPAPRSLRRLRESSTRSSVATPCDSKKTIATRYLSEGNNDGCRSIHYVEKYADSNDGTSCINALTESEGKVIDFNEVLSFNSRNKDNPKDAENIIP